MPYVESKLGIDDLVSVFGTETGEHFLRGRLRAVEELGQSEGVPQSLPGRRLRPRHQRRA